MNETTTTHEKPEFAQAIRQWRGTRTQARAAADLDVPLATLCAWEQGRQEPTGYVRRLVLRSIGNTNR